MWQAYQWHYYDTKVFQEKTRIYQIWLDRIIELPSTLSLWRSWCSVPFSGIWRNDLFCFMLDVIHLYFVCSKRHKIIYFCILKIMIENIQNVICTIQKRFIINNMYHTSMLFRNIYQWGNIPKTFVYIDGQCKRFMECFGVSVQILYLAQTDFLWNRFL